MKIIKNIRSDSPEFEIVIEIDTEASQYGAENPRLPTHQEYQIIRDLLELPVDRELTDWEIKDHKFISHVATPTLAPETAAEMIGDPPPYVNTLNHTGAPSEPTPVKRAVHHCGAPDCPGLLSPHGMLTCRQQALTETLVAQGRDAGHP